jgi:DNA-directed RNA polymerase specialized sigma24 family protein
MTHRNAATAALYTPPCIVVEDRCAPSILERVIREVEPYLERAADHIAADYPAAVDDMVQEACITLWQLDLGRFARRDAPYVKRILRNRMIAVCTIESRGGLTTGRSRDTG